MCLVVDANRAGKQTIFMPIYGGTMVISPLGRLSKSLRGRILRPSLQSLRSSRSLNINALIATSQSLETSDLTLLVPNNDASLCNYRYIMYYAS